MTYRYQNVADYDWLMAEIDKHETPQAVALGKLLADTFSIRSVIDIGCGSGIYLVPFRERGIEVYGVDGAPRAGQHILDAFELVDLRNPWTPPRVFDMALCIEVAEHLKPVHAPTLVATVARCAPLVFWSAAKPRQGGEGHYNEETPEYWIDLFGPHGFVLDAGHTSAVHAVIDVDPVYDHCHWLRWNSIVLRRA